MKRWFVAIWFGLNACLCAPPVFSQLISFDAATYQVNPSDQFSVIVSISGLGPEVLRAISFDLVYNGAILDNFAVTHFVVPQLGGIGNSTFSATFGPDSTTVNDASLLTDAQLIGLPQADAFVLFDFRFLALAFGGSSLVEIANLNAIGLNDQPLQISVEGTACIAIGDVACPAVIAEPGTLALLALGLAAITVSRRRRHQTIG